MPRVFWSGTREYCRVPLGAVRENGVYIDPTSDAVYMAFTTPTVEPQQDEWISASWETDATTEPDTYIARCLISGHVPGGGTVELDLGRYATWVRITDSPEAPVKFAGFIVMAGLGAESS